MAKFLWLVFTEPASTEVEGEFNDWYDRQHVPDVLRVPGVTAVQRLKVATALEVPGKYLSIYEIEADDPSKVMAAVSARSGTDQMPLSSALDRSSVRQMVYAPLSERVEGTRLR